MTIPSFHNRHMKTKKLLIILSILVLVFTSCTTVKNVSIESSVSPVYDTSSDAGKLTARYLNLKEIYYDGTDKCNVGDCVVYTSPEGLVMVVDCSNQNSFPEIDDQLKMLGIEKIDIFVMSHAHADHIGCFVQLAQHYPIGQVYKNSHDYTSGTYKKAMNYIKNTKIPLTILEDGDSFMFGKDVKVQIFNPVGDCQERAEVSIGECNNCSLAMRLEYKDSSFWTSGDLYIAAEQEIIDRYGSAIDSDVMKMNHHGYDTSNGPAFIETISPKIAVGMHESITSQTVALRIALKNQALTFYTCQDGAVKIATTGDGKYEVNCELLREITFYGKPNESLTYIVE